MAVNPKLKITRNQLAKFIKEHDTIKVFESLIDYVNELFPGDESDASITANTTLTTTNYLLSDIHELKKDVVDNELTGLTVNAKTNYLISEVAEIKKKPLNLITVASVGADYISIKEACESYTDSSQTNPYFISAAPGDYKEDPFYIPEHTTVFLNNARLEPNNLSSNFIRIGRNSAIRNGGILKAPTTGACFYSDGDQGATATNIRISGDGTGIGFLVTGGGSMTVLDTAVASVETAFWANAGSLVISTGSAQRVTYGLRVSNGGFITGAVYGSFGNVDIDIKQDDAISGMRFLDGLINTDRVEAVDWGKLFLTYVSDKEDDEAFVISQELSVGNPELGRESVFGEGDSYTRGMLVYTETPANVFTDVSTDARSASGSSFTFPGVLTDNAIYIASSLISTIDAIEHFGIKTKVLTAAVKGSGIILIEYWNGVTWVELNGMEADSGDRYFPHGNDYFQALGSHHIRYNSQLATDSWTKNDPMLLGTNYYWVRFRISATITTAPIFEQFKLHTNRAEINADGWQEYFGKARPIGQLGINFAASKPFEGAMQSQTLYINDNIGVGFTNNKFTTTTDKAGINGFLPFDCDTSSPIILEWAGHSTVNQTIAWTVRYWWVTDNGTDQYYTTEPAPITGAKSVTVSQAITAGNVSMFSAILDIQEMVSRRDGAYGDEIWISLQPSALSGRFSITSSQATYTKWCNGGHI